MYWEGKGVIEYVIVLSIGIRDFLDNNKRVRFVNYKVNDYDWDLSG